MNLNSTRHTRIRILEATATVFNQKGMKFTMDDLAKELTMSKKTIYSIFRDKEALLYAMVDYAFDNIKECEKQVFCDDSLDTVEKLRKMLGVLPDSYKEIDFRQLFSLRSKYPKIYEKIEERLESGWDSTIALLERGVKEGVLRPVNVVIFKATFEAAIEQFFGRDLLISHDISYSDALDELVSLLFDGIIKK